MSSWKANANISIRSSISELTDTRTCIKAIIQETSKDNLELTDFSNDLDKISEVIIFLERMKCKYG